MSLSKTLSEAELQRELAQRPSIETAISTVTQTAADQDIHLTWQENVIEPVVVMGGGDRLSQDLSVSDIQAKVKAVRQAKASLDTLSRRRLLCHNVLLWLLSN